MHDHNFTRGYGLLENFLAKKRARQANLFIGENMRQGRILDVGCGTTPFFLTSTKFNEKYGLDPSLKTFSSENLRLAKFNIEENSKLPFADDFFDVVAMLAVFEHLDMSTLVDLLGDIRRILKRGGRLVITTPTVSGNSMLKIMARLKLVSSEEVNEHKGAYSGEKIADIVATAGFEKKNMRYGSFEFFMNNWFFVEK